MHIQYIFTAFNDNLLNSNKILIAAYQQKIKTKLEISIRSGLIRGK